MIASLAPFPILLVVGNQFQLTSAWFVQDNVTIQAWSGGTYHHDHCTFPYKLEGSIKIDNTGSACYMNPLESDSLPLIHWFDSSSYVGSDGEGGEQQVIAHSLVLNEKSPDYDLLLPKCNNQGICDCIQLDQNHLRTQCNRTTISNNNKNESSDILWCGSTLTDRFQHRYLGCGVSNTTLLDHNPILTPVHAIITVDYDHPSSRSSARSSSRVQACTVACTAAVLISLIRWGLS